MRFDLQVFEMYTLNQKFHAILHVWRTRSMAILLISLKMDRKSSQDMSCKAFAFYIQVNKHSLLWYIPVLCLRHSQAHPLPYLHKKHWLWMKSAYYVGKFAAGSPTRHCICKYLWTVGTIIHICEQNEPVCSHHKLTTNIMRRAINAHNSPWVFAQGWLIFHVKVSHSPKIVQDAFIDGLCIMSFCKTMWIKNSRMRIWIRQPVGECTISISTTAKSGWMREDLLCSYGNGCGLALSLFLESGLHLLPLL